MTILPGRIGEPRVPVRDLVSRNKVDRNKEEQLGSGGARL